MMKKILVLLEMEKEGRGNGERNDRKNSFNGSVKSNKKMTIRSC